MLLLLLRFVASLLLMRLVLLQVSLFMLAVAVTDIPYVAVDTVLLAVVFFHTFA